MNRKTIYFVIIIVLLTGLFSLYLISKPVEKQVKDKYDIRGIIKNITRNKENISIIFVDGYIDDDTTHDKASITVTNNTIITQGLLDKIFNLDDLKEGALVEIELTGPIRESYPIQADAKKVNILDKDQENYMKYIKNLAYHVSKDDIYINSNPIIEKLVVNDEIIIIKESSTINIKGYNVYKFTYENRNEVLGPPILYIDANTLEVLGWQMRE